jgi:hypothetical protein
MLVTNAISSIVLISNSLFPNYRATTFADVLMEMLDCVDAKLASVFGSTTVYSFHAGMI